MRAFGLISLVLALLIVGLLAKKQLAATSSIAVPAVPAVPAAAVADAPAAPALQGGNGDVRAQSQQLQQQYKQALDAAMQPRPLPDDAR